MTPTFIARPAPRVRQEDPLYDALRKTASNGKAIRVRLRGKSLMQTQDRWRKTLSRSGYVLHYVSLAPKTVAAWTERAKNGGAA